MLSKQTAYEKWLGIKAQQQPPTLYRLLGVEAFESDADIISNSADSRMGYLRQFQVGDNAKVAEDILNEVSHARVTLLNADKKAAYDARLRQRLAPQAKAAVSPSPLPRAESIAAPMRPSQASAATSALDLDALTSEAWSTNPASHGRAKKKSTSLVWVAAAAGVALMIVAIVVVNSLSGGDDSSTKDKSKAVAVKPETPKPPAHPVAPEPSISPKPSKVEPEHPVAPPVEPPTPTPTPPPVAVATSDHAPPDSEKPAPSPPAEPPKAPDVTAPAPTEAAIIPVPDANAQAAATKLVKEVYGKEMAAAKTANQKQALAKSLLEKAMESEEDRVSQFVLFRLSKETAEQASDCQTAFDSIEETDKIFQIDALEMKVDALKKCALAAATVEQQALLVEKANQVCDQAVAKDNFVVAKSIIDLAFAEAKKSKDESLIRKSTERKAEIEKAAHAYVTAKSAISTLQKTPVDPEANLAVGKYNCFVKGDWESGLPKLVLAVC